MKFSTLIDRSIFYIFPAVTKWIFMNEFFIYQVFEIEYCQLGWWLLGWWVSVELVGWSVGEWGSGWWSVGRWSEDLIKTPPSNPRTWKTHHLNLSMTVSLSKNCGLFTSYYGMTLHQVVEVKGQLARTRCHEFNSSALQSRWNKKERHGKT